MDREFEKSLCLGTGISFILLSVLISVPNIFVLIALYKNPFRCFRKSFAVFLVFISLADLFAGSVVCTGEAVMRFSCAFGDKTLPKDGDVVKLLGYTGVNSSILLVTAMSVDRFISVTFPLFYRNKVKRKHLILCNASIIAFSTMFSLLQLTGISIHTYVSIDIHLHTTFPLATTSVCYAGIFMILRKRSRVGIPRAHKMRGEPALCVMRRVDNAKNERKIAITSLLILLFLISSLVPYFITVILEANCLACREQKWLFVLKESSVVFLFFNSFVNPCLTTFRVNELKESVKVVCFHRR